MELLVPDLEHLDAYREALKLGFWSDNLRRAESAHEELQRIADDPAAFVASLHDREAKGGPIRLPDGSTVPRLPGYRRWMWDDGFCGHINFRWQPGTAALPEHVLGHIGYAVVPWRENRGYATRALALLLPECRREGLPYIEVTTDPHNLASQKVITRNGGRLLGAFHSERHGTDNLRFRIDL